MNTNSQMTVREIALGNSQAARVFETFGLDYCCGGQRSLEDACRRAKVAVDTVLEALRSPVAGEEDSGRWAAAPLKDLAEHIIGKHHAFVRTELPRLTELIRKVNGKHGTRHGELARVAELFQALASELTLHMLKEERVLFPMIQALEDAVRAEDFDAANFRGIEFPIERMIHEHEDAGEVLRDLRSETGGFQAPADGCASFGALYQGLEEFERDLHQHIHLENNILFPRTLEMAGTGAMRPEEISGVIG